MSRVASPGVENIRLELAKAFIIAGVPIEEIPAKVQALERFCEYGRQGVYPCFTSSEAMEQYRKQKEALTLETTPRESAGPG